MLRQAEGTPTGVPGPLVRHHEFPAAPPAVLACPGPRTRQTLQGPVAQVATWSPAHQAEGTLEVAERADRVARAALVDRLEHVLHADRALHLDTTRAAGVDCCHVIGRRWR